jgi:hypothetical protein
VSDEVFMLRALIAGAICTATYAQTNPETAADKAANDLFAPANVGTTSGRQDNNPAKTSPETTPVEWRTVKKKLYVRCP